MPGLIHPKPVALVLAVITAATVAAAPAAARQHHRALAAPAWSPEKLPSGLGPLSGLSCSGAGAVAQCVAVGWTTSGKGAVVVSRNDGATWTLAHVPHAQRIGRLGNVACSGARFCLAASYAGAAISTTDGGSNWTLDRRPPEASYFHGLGQISCVGERCWINEIDADAVLFTANGGKSWSLQNLPGLPCAGGCVGFVSSGVAFANSHDGYATGFNQCGGFGVTQCEGIIWHTVDGGAHWHVLRSSLELPAVDAVACISASDCWAAAATFKTGEIYRTTDGGSRWVRQTLPAFRGFFNATSCQRGARADRCLAVGQNEKGTAAVIVQTIDAGHHWLRDRAPRHAGALGSVAFVGAGGRAVGENSTHNGPVALGS